MAEVLVVSGSGPYADAWHPFPETSARLAAVIAALGHTVQVTEAVEDRLAHPGRCDLVVINIGNPAEPRPSELVAASAEGLEHHLAAGCAVLGVHATATAYATMPQLSSILGGHWERGRTMHPPQGQTVVNVRASSHPIVAGMTDFEIFDERYCHLQTSPDIEVICDHAFDGVRHPLVWAREADGARVVYDGLGHDARSYASAGHVELLQRSVRWLLRSDDSA